MQTPSAVAMLLRVTCLTGAGLIGAGVVGGLGGCVTEVIPVGGPHGPANRPLNPGTGTPVSAIPTPPNTTSSTRIAASIRPLGTVPYDGLTLPLVTPNGRWIVTQTGSLPPWEAVFASPGAAPVPANAIAAFEVVDGALRPAPWPVPPAGTPSPTAGLLLGRSSGDGWVLVEQPNQNGSRWIGTLDLASGTVRWLVQGKTVNAQALMLRDGTLIYTRRPVDQPASELVIQHAIAPSAATQAGTPALAVPPERTIKRDGWYYCQPMSTPDQSIVAVLAIGANESELLAYSTTRLDAAGAPLLVGKQTLGPMSAAAAYQAVTSIEACPPDVDSSLSTTILLVNADRGRLASWDPIRGTMAMLPASVMAAVRVHSPVASGLVMASSRGVDFWAGSGLPARLVAGAYIPRSYGEPTGSRLVLLSPQTDSSAPHLRVLAVEMLAPKP